MLPEHLKRYVVEQDYSRYSPEDQEIWRFIMRQLREFLSLHAHPCYVEGLAKTGIEVDQIPDIRVMSDKLEKFGWRAIAVSGFIPPAAFMELQSLGYLPIASDMRTIDHVMYTPAPDIVHEAAGHAPILVEENFASYLKAYAQVARKAIISHQDMEQYEAIRVLSDLKEDPHSTTEQILEAERHLTHVTKAITHLSEAAYLSRMNWWTAEYGLIGSLENPRIFGAGLLSSIGEAKSCLDPKVKKIPLTIDCINYAYDITEPQPQLFVTPDFSRLSEVLEQLAQTMAFRTGGLAGLEKALIAETVNTVELNSGLQISGRLKSYRSDQQNPAYLQFEGPTQLCYGNHQLIGHGKATHAHGFGTPVGLLEGTNRCLSEMTDAELLRLGIQVGSTAQLAFRSGTVVKGTVTGTLRAPNGKLLLISFKDCKVTHSEETMFDPSWGEFDMGVGSGVTSVFGGPADRVAYGESDDFVAKIIPRKKWAERTLFKHSLYQEVRDIREAMLSGRLAANADTSNQLERVLTKVESEFPHDWLLLLSIYELSLKLPSDHWRPRVALELQNLSDSEPSIGQQIRDGLRLLHS